MTEQEQKAFTAMREALEQSLRGMSAAIFGTDTFKVSSRGDFASKVEKQIQEALTAANAVNTDSHPDDIAVDKFAAAMKAKMAKQRAKGYSGWDDKEDCPAELLQDRLVKHIAKGDPVDVGNFAMMLWNRGEDTAAPNVLEPLTDERINELADIAFADYMEDKNDDHDLAFARAIEASHGITKGTRNAVFRWFNVI